MRMDEIKYSSDGKFKGNILIGGRARCGKTTFVQNLGKNKLFGDILRVYWVSKISLSAEREGKIKALRIKKLIFTIRKIWTILII